MRTRAPVLLSQRFLVATMQLLSVHGTNSVRSNISPRKAEGRQSSVDCLLCGHQDVSLFSQIGALNYFRCDQCQLVFLEPSSMPDQDAAKAHYDLHENDPNDPNYRAFLRRLANPLVEKITAGSYGLDYGCGPGPGLAALLGEQGFSMEVYDPIYADDEDVLEETYDFITCTEVVEHFHLPKAEFERFDQLLKPGGWLAIMTSWLTDEIDFDHWYYRCDPTHVCFYNHKTLERWAAEKNWLIYFPAPNVALIQKLA